MIEPFEFDIDLDQIFNDLNVSDVLSQVRIYVTDNWIYNGSKAERTAMLMIQSQPPFSYTPIMISWGFQKWKFTDAM